MNERSKSKEGKSETSPTKSSFFFFLIEVYLISSVSDVQQSDSVMY